MSKGTDFEKLALKFLVELFEEVGFLVIEKRLQTSGTQNGFDIVITFLDDYEQERRFCFECKNYDTPLSYEKILVKLGELSSLPYKVDGFFAISPKKDISNIHHLMEQGFLKRFDFPFRHWTPETYIEEYFALNTDIYDKVYEKQSDPMLDRESVLKKVKSIFKRVLDEKDALRLVTKIIIEDADRQPDEEDELRTSLDEKLMALNLLDEEKIRYHQLRCDYKVYLEKLQDLNSGLRQDIKRWQDNMRFKAHRLTNKFENGDYTPLEFFHEFFDQAEKDINKFMDDDSVTGDGEKLMNGIVFELAAECPLRWSKP